MEKTTDASSTLQDHLMISDESRAPEMTLLSNSPELDQCNVGGDEDVGGARVRSTTPYFKSSRFWELGFCLLFFAVTFAILEMPIPARQRPIPFQVLEQSGDYVRNLTVDESLDGETISSTLLLFLSTILPLLIQELLSYGWQGSREMSFYDMHATLCVYLVGFSITSIVTDSVKLYVGYLRPIFYEKCQPDAEYSRCTADDGGGDFIRKSFPSGHASFSFYGLTLLTLYIHSRFGMADRIRERRRAAMASAAVSMGRTRLTDEAENESNDSGEGRDLRARVVSILSLLPMCLATFIAASRIVDNLHFPADVVGGAVLGSSVSIFVHGLWFCDI